MNINFELTTGKLTPNNFEVVETGMGSRAARLLLKNAGSDTTLDPGAQIWLRAWKPERFLEDPPDVEFSDWDAPVDPETDTAYTTVYNDLELPKGTLLARIDHDPGTGEVEGEIFHLIVMPAGATAAEVAAAVAGLVAFTPVGSVSSSNMQSAIEELDSEKLPKAGGTMTGNLVFTSGAKATGLPTPSASSDAVPKSYVDGLTDPAMKAALPLDCSANPNYPAAQAGDNYRVTVAGKVGGASGLVVNVGDLISCHTDSAGGTQAAVGSNWFILESNRDAASDTVPGVVELATQAESEALSDATRALTPATLPARLKALLGLTWAADKFAYFTSVSSVALGDLSTFMRGLLASVNEISLRNSIGVSTIDNGQRNTFAKIAGWSTTGAPPVRMLVWGDSLSGGIQEGPNMARQGLNAGPSAFTGGSANVSGATSIWVNGFYTNIASGGSATYAPSGASDDYRAGTWLVCYVAESGAGTLAVDVSYNGGSSWSSLGTINASNATQIGASASFITSQSYAQERSRLRLTASGGAVKVISVVPHHADGVGVILLGGLFNGTGHDAVEELSTPDAILQPIWNALAPDLVLVCFADEETTYQAGGGFRQMYEKLKGWRAATDYILIAPNPASTDDNLRVASARAMFALAREKNETFFDGYSIFGSYALGNAAGMYADGVHLTTLGDRFRNLTMWGTLALGRASMGQNLLAGYAPIWTPAQGVIQTLGLVLSRGTTGNAFNWLTRKLVVDGPILFGDTAYPGDRGRDWGYTATSLIAKFQSFGIDWVTYTATGAVGIGFGKPISAPCMKISSSTTAVTLTADNQTIVTTDLSFIRVTSDDATPTNRTALLSNGVQGQILKLLFIHATNGMELLSSSNCKLGSTWTPTQWKMLTLFWSSADSAWIEDHRS